MDTSRVIGIVTAAAFLLFAGCGGGGSGGGLSSTGTLALQITDAPFDSDGCVTHAWVHVTEASVKVADGTFMVLDLADSLVEMFPSDPQLTEGWVNPPKVGEVWIDLLALRNGVETQLAAGSLAVGSYSELRLLIEDTVLVLDDPATETHDNIPSTFKIPSGSSSGLKIKFDPPFEVTSGSGEVGTGDTPTVLVLDFDLARSFHVAGAGGMPTFDDLKDGRAKVIYTPTIRPIIQTNMGILEGLVSETKTVIDTTIQTRFATATAAWDVTVFVTLPDEADIVAATRPEGPDSALGAGYYALFLEAGEYDLYVESVDGDVFVDHVVILAGEVLEQSIDIASTETTILE